MSRDHSEQQLQYLGIFVHGVLSGLHILGIVYNAKRRNWLDVTAHGGAALYSGWAVAKHMQALEESRKVCDDHH